MRYVQGPQLKTIVQSSGPLPPERLLPIMSQVGGALDAAHARGLLHRDVKPGNILVDALGGRQPSDRIYLCDFGLTKQASIAQRADADRSIHGHDRLHRARANRGQGC